MFKGFCNFFGFEKLNSFEALRDFHLFCAIAWILWSDDDTIFVVLANLTFLIDNYNVLTFYSIMTGIVSAQSDKGQLARTNSFVMSSTLFGFQIIIFKWISWFKWKPLKY